MDFRTELLSRPSKHKIDTKGQIVTLGSCFSDDIGKRLADYKFQVSINPLGTVYNPISIHKLLTSSIQKLGPASGGFIKRDDAFFHFDFHSSRHGASKDDLSQKLNQTLEALSVSLQATQYLIITYGTSWVYEQNDSKQIVSNCHKMPQKKFNKFLLTQKQIIGSFESLYAEIKKLNKDLRIILTVSPVRHVKDTLELNSVSKSILRLSCHTLTEAYADVEYFPSYEIMMDDLRDYRFYKSDLIHPSEVAIDYIWEKFSQAYFSSETTQFIQEWDKIRSALAHKPFQANSLSHQQFLKATLNQLKQLSATVDVREEIEYVRRQISD